MTLRIEGHWGDRLFDDQEPIGMAYDYLFLIEENPFGSRGWFRTKSWDIQSASELVKVGVLEKRLLKDNVVLYYPGHRWDEFFAVMDGWKESWCPY